MPLSVQLVRSNLSTIETRNFSYFGTFWQLRSTESANSVLRIQSKEAPMLRDDGTQFCRSWQSIEKYRWKFVMLLAWTCSWSVEKAAAPKKLCNVFYNVCHPFEEKPWICRFRGCRKIEPIVDPWPPWSMLMLLITEKLEWLSPFLVGSESREFVTQPTMCKIVKIHPTSFNDLYVLLCKRCSPVQTVAWVFSQTHKPKSCKAKHSLSPIHTVDWPSHF